MANGNMFRMVTWGLTIPIVLFYVLSLVGCISNSPGIPDIFLLKLTTPETETPYQVRIGYFGLCAGSDDAKLSCLPSFSLGRAPGTTVFNTTLPAELTRLVELGHEVQVKVIFFVPLLLASVLFFVSTTTVFLWRNVPQISPMAATVAFLMHSLALGLLLAAATAVSMVVNALHFAVVEITRGQNEINVEGGKALQTFQWLTVIFSCVWQVCILKRYRSDMAGGKRI
ncbi:hypothetical protein MCOR27_003367 [Pyricularia oryzae]|uniref:Uncharacterized protein n=5 Tax=Pyricularia TaxID=48558 RepID=A0ABQ8NJL0_PYRGI|nr:uncharacterized protein MGG_07761 [Pyricularia oryzae 70-15]ELQ44345.1 hypothetical protein OOU_Y34scaffold00090g10 [Pyricularia oryzae Y34]KAH8848350.1 hypothetical protein MCOR01_001726 [Pyricularia oryzae]KAI6298051.1 hypothetical protein MCOR33_005763 [Pyricularia grisea]EHA53166.1 hypothetical protein MGG_07761 [Pyricularia oryzae 70-15]KAH9429704.1 hypothetical protein MCOR02_009442 [Pyricularia oryzae]